MTDRSRDDQETILYQDARKEAIRRFGKVCIYCGVQRKRITVDHIVPRSLGGSDHVDNLVPCCRPCNETRGVWSIELFFEMLMVSRGSDALLGIIDRIYAKQRVCSRADRARRAKTRR